MSSSGSLADDMQIQSISRHWPYSYTLAKSMSALFPTCSRVWDCRKVSQQRITSLDALLLLMDKLGNVDSTSLHTLSISFIYLVASIETLSLKVWPVLHDSLLCERRELSKVRNGFVTQRLHGTQHSLNWYNWWSVWGFGHIRIRFSVCWIHKNFNYEA